MKMQSKNISIVIVLVAVCLIFLCLPWIYFYLAINARDNTTMLKYHELSVKTALLPTVKAKMYEELASYYLVVENNGPIAIENYENAYKYKKSYEDLDNLGLLYTIKGDYNNAIKVYKANSSFSLMARTYVLLEDYKNALFEINYAIKNKPDNCWNYRTRAIIYKNMNQYSLAQNDYEHAIRLCPGKKKVIEYDVNTYRTSIKEGFDKLKVKHKFIITQVYH